MPLPARSNSVRRGGRPERRRHSCHWANQGRLRWATKTHQFETVSPFAGASQDQTGESERVHMGRHLQTPGASDQNFVLIMMIWSCIKQLILETQWIIQFTWTDIYRHLKQHCVAFSLSSHLKMFTGTRSCALARVFSIRVSWVRRAKRCPSSGIF